VPDQRVSLDECLLAYTAAGAYADFAEGRAGQLKIGFDADLVLVAGSLEGLSQKEDAATVAMTICGGTITYGTV
jgi:predicted amidohydrolase YtcJ